MIRRIAAAHEANRHLAQELVQEIYLAIWQALPAYRQDASTRTFVARIATNRAATHVMRAIRIPVSCALDEQLVSPVADPEAEVIAGDRKEAVLAAVRGLPMSYRHAVMLTLEGLGPAEVAAILGISTNAVAVRLTRAREMLRESMGEST